MKTTEISNGPAFPIIGPNPILISLASKPPGPSTGRLRALFEWRPRLWLLLLALALPMAAQAQYLYSTANGEVTITGYSGPGGNVIIPGTLGGLPVKHIGSEAFRAFSPSGITNVTIPNSVTSIGVRAFLAQEQLRTVTFGNGLITIGTSAFTRCTSLTSVARRGLRAEPIPVRVLAYIETRVRFHEPVPLLSESHRHPTSDNSSEPCGQYIGQPTPN
jgi:hypothetical protein